MQLEGRNNDKNPDLVIYFSIIIVVYFSIIIYTHSSF